jgi:hypothetical protein
VFKEITGPPSDLLYKYFKELVLKKNEETRCLATDLLIKFQQEESEEADVLRNLAKSSTFKQSDLPTKAIHIAKRIIASRALSPG